MTPAPGTAPQDRVVDGAAIAARRQGWRVADARHGGEAAVTVAAGWVGGTTQATLSAPTVPTLVTDRCARQALAPARARVFRKVRTELVRSIAREPVGA